MRPSRLMPAYAPGAVSWPWRVGGFAVLVAVVGLFAWGLWAKPVPVLTSTGAVVFIIAVLEYRNRLRLRRLAQPRAGESICSYARALPIRELDPWVVRAVFEELQPYVADHGIPFPIRPADRLAEELGVDAEELNETVAPQIAQRIGRSLDGAEHNPYYGKVMTVEDLVRFFCAQPESPSGRTTRCS